MIRTILLAAVFVAIAVGGGAGSVLFALERFGGADAVHVGPWTTFPRFGTPQADPYAKARFARQGGLALGQAEGISFSAERDSAGRPLDGRCTYDFEGVVPPARFWTLHAATARGRHLPGIGKKVSTLESRGILRRPDNSVLVAVSGSPQAGNWLAVDAKGPFRLVLTLYDTPISGEAGVMDVELPKLRREACG